MRITIGLVGVLGLGVSATITFAQPQAAPLKRGAVLLPPERLEAPESTAARGAAEDLVGSTPVTRSSSPAWLAGTDPGVRPAGGIAGNVGNKVQPQPLPGAVPAQSEPSFVSRSLDRLKGTFATEKTERPMPVGAGGQPGGADPRNPANASNGNNANAAFRGTAANGAPVYAGPPAYRWYGWGSVTPGANPYAPTGNYPRASANWHSVTGATPGAFPVPVMNPMRPTPGTEPPVYANTPAPRTSAPVYASALNPTSPGGSGPDFPVTQSGDTRLPAVPVNTPATTPPFVPPSIESPRPLAAFPANTTPAPLPTMPVSTNVAPAQPLPVSVPTLTSPPMPGVPTITQPPLSVSTPALVTPPAMGAPEPVVAKQPEATGPRVSDTGTFSGIPLPKLPELPPVPPVSLAPPAVSSVPVTVTKPVLTVVPSKPVEEQPKWETGTARPAGEEWNTVAPASAPKRPVLPTVEPQSRGTDERQPIARGQMGDNRPDPIVTLITKLCENRAEGVDVRFVGSKKITVCFEVRTAPEAQKLVKDISARPELAPYHVDFCVLVK